MNTTIAHIGIIKFDTKISIPAKMKAKMIIGLRENLAISNSFSIKSSNNIFSFVDRKPRDLYINSHRQKINK